MTKNILPAKQLSTLRIIRVKELAALLCVDRVTLWRWEKDGEMPHSLRLGPRLVGWRQEDIQAWLDEKVRTS